LGNLLILYIIPTKLFFKTVLKIERPKNYMPFPIEDLKEEQEVQVYKEFLNI